VHRGESLGRIATQLGVSVDQICRENNISDRNEIHPGQKLHVTVKGQPSYASKTSGDKKYHTVQSGDTVWSIAQQYGVNLSEIIGWNRLSRAGRIYPGQRLIVSR
jgi:LysM repeat protein